MTNHNALLLQEPAIDGDGPCSGTDCGVPRSASQTFWPQGDCSRWATTPPRMHAVFTYVVQIGRNPSFICCTSLRHDSQVCPPFGRKCFGAQQAHAASLIVCYHHQSPTTMSRKSPADHPAPLQHHSQPPQQRVPQRFLW